MEIRFSHNWNGKLGNKLFTTIRRYTTEKAKYYCDHLGDVFDIYLKQQGEAKQYREVGKAKLEDIWLSKLKDISPPLLMLDTGYTEIEKILKLFKNFGVGLEDEVMVLILKQEEKS